MAVAEPMDLMEVGKNATYFLPMHVWLWLKNEAARRGISASALIVELVRREQEKEAA